MTREELEQDDDFTVGGADETVSTGNDIDIEDDSFDLDFGDDEPEVEHEEETPVTDTPEEEPVEEDDEEVESEEESEEEGEEDEEETEIFSDIVNLMLDKGVLEIDPEKEYDDSEEGLAEIIEDTLRIREEERLNRLSPAARRLLEIEEMGGDIAQAIEELHSFDYNNIDLSVDENKEALVREHLLEQGYEEEDLEDTIEGLKDLNKLDKHASIAQKYFVGKQEAEAEAYAQRIESEMHAREEQERQTIQNVMHKIDTVESLGAFSNIPKQDREAFKRYLFEKDENGQTQAQRDNSLDAILINEFNKFKKFDYGVIQNRATTKATIDWRKKAARAIDKTQEARGSGTRRYSRPDEGGFSLGDMD
jgi:hypothetical protein